MLAFQFVVIVLFFLFWVCVFGLDVSTTITTTTTTTINDTKSSLPPPPQKDAETIRVTFDPTRLTYADLLDMFLSLHTPSDPRFSGTQYRSAIFVYNSEHRRLAEELLSTKGRLGAMIAVEDASDFYQAEEYHQNYLVKMMDR
jgi:peptide-methionine (S)-S-oxide reductase